MKNGRPNRLDDVWRRVQIGEPDECWPWLGGLRPNGYGQMTIRYRNHSPHRIAFEVATGIAPPKGMFVCHTCDNPPCCNPAHLYLGTPADNSRDRDARGRLVPLRGDSKSQAKITNTQAAAIRRRRMAGERGSDLAREFGIAQQTVCNIFKGRRYAA